MEPWGRRLLNQVLRGLTPATPRGAARGPSRAASTEAEAEGGGAAGRSYPGDVGDRFPISYSPHPDGRPDPGEVVWAWVPYEEDHHRGKDRPVLLVGRADPWLYGLMLTSKDHDRDAAQETAAGRAWLDLGTGPWDSKGRPSEVRLNRVIRLDPTQVRREGAVLDRQRFTRVTAAMARALGWPSGGT